MVPNQAAAGPWEPVLSPKGPGSSSVRKWLLPHGFSGRSDEVKPCAKSPTDGDGG